MCEVTEPTLEEVHAFFNEFKTKCGVAWYHIRLALYDNWDGVARMAARRYSDACDEEGNVCVFISKGRIMVGVDRTLTELEREFWDEETEYLFAGGRYGFPAIDVDWETGQVQEREQNDE